MKSLTQTLQDKGNFIGFTVVGDPDFDHTVEYVVDMAQAGADVVELGIAFSDPSADGPTILSADQRALDNGSTTAKVFETVARIRQKTDVPLVFLTYTNIVFKHGYEKFLAQMQAFDVQGIILPDLPLEEQGEFLALAKQYERDLIQLVTSQSGDRLPAILKNASGFVYVVSSLGITGTRQKLSNEANQLIEQIRQYSNISVAVGFGISQVEQARQFPAANAIIVGSAIVDIIAQHPHDAGPYLTEFIIKMKEAQNA
ncbi:tryptophan synthase subunit alpha [Convivina praedatoris]|uniref:Tryptophan synthase alpha chain n=1 Tax=Convivina praedatoris TaxID=2880963 RepID=A0ABM9D1M7_9LACO|nr:tryptophan synthase subunit alpha [Convivina sp. LMG 32447]CAH1851854.1 Tryptophan synthase alpha chain [Convivina sp. LMG 32447]CAH1853929.1 Tryptophan synthase alpha chain [Convivina sp. LMG 32447]